MAYYALILAGGGGTRLWPLSRRDRPKQMLPLVNDRTMFQMSVERLAPLFPPERIFVVIGREHLDALQAQCPEIPVGNFIVEPEGRDTGPAAGLGALWLYSLDPDAVVAVLTADHYIGDPERFRQALRVAHTLAEQGRSVALGITPSFPSSGYAYLERGDPIDEIDGFACYWVAGFREKPHPAVAAELLLAGRYSWNSGMLVCRADRVLQEIRRQQPGLGAVLDRLAPTVGTPAHEAAIRQWWPTVERVSIDQAILNHTADMVMVNVDIGWSDVGSWSTLYEVLKPQEAENVVQGSAELVQLRTRGTFVMSDRLVVAIGVEDIIIVDTEDVLLICRRDQSEDVRQIIKLLKASGQDHLL